MVTMNRNSRRIYALIEGLTLTLFAAALLAAISLQRGSFGWSWDALNHHIYLGMIAETPRWSNDVAAAASQTYQYPYLYWPTYRISLLNGSGAVVSAAWSATQAALMMMPVWLLIYRMFPDAEMPWEARAYRVLAFGLALSSLPVIGVLGTTANDALAAVPVLWALAIGLGFPGRLSAAIGSAGLIGAAIAFKFSNVLFLPMLAIVCWQPSPPRLPLRSLLSMSLALIAGFGIIYTPWGWQLWKETGNPFYPYFARVFS